MANPNFTPSSEWRPIPNFPFYEVNDTGQVRSLRFGKIKILKAWTQKGYPHVALMRNNKSHRKPVHHIVLETFVGPCPQGLECCHGDDVKSNNALSNLRWDTHGANVDDQRRHGNLKLRRGGSGVRSPKKLTADQVREIRGKWVPYFYPMPRLAKEYGVCLAMIQKIIQRRAWGHI